MPGAVAFSFQLHAIEAAIAGPTASAGLPMTIAMMATIGAPVRRVHLSAVKIMGFPSVF
jgi:hypothetical protein